uniref:Putative ovule protein n=1 Tax=Solanum chacoense TaxID=4108 RepID=A0A0V0H7I4_SOLCH
MVTTFCFCQSVCLKCLISFYGYPFPLRYSIVFNILDDFKIYMGRTPAKIKLLNSYEVCFCSIYDSLLFTVP